MTLLGGWAGRRRLARKMPKSHVMTERPMSGFKSFCVRLIMFFWLLFVPVMLKRGNEKKKNSKGVQEGHSLRRCK